MRICLVTPELPPYRHGGIGSYVQILAQGYARRGHAVTIVGPGLHPESVLHHEWGESVSLDYQPRFLWRLERICTRYVAWKSLWGALAVRRFLRARQEFDIVEVSNFPGFGALLPSGRAKRVIRCSTSAREAGMPAGRMAERLEARSCRHADLVVTHSKASAHRLRLNYAYQGPVEVIPLGIPDVTSSAQPSRQGLRLVFVGRAEDRKGADVLITALGQVLPRFPHVRFCTIGGDFDAFAARQACRARDWVTLQQNCPGQIEQHGRVNEAAKQRLLAEAHWLVIPSRYESFGLVAIEALRAGTPVLVAAAGGLREVAVTYPSNRFCAPGDAKSLERGLTEIIALGSGGALALRSGARAAYMRCFQADQMVERSLQSYQSLLVNRSKVCLTHPERNNDETYPGARAINQAAELERCHSHL